MKKNCWSVTALTTVFILWGFVGLGSERWINLPENDRSSAFFSPDVKNVKDIVGLETRKQNVYTHDNEIRVPEVKTLNVTHVSGSKATLEGRIEKFEYIDGPKPIRTGNKEYEFKSVIRHKDIELEGNICTFKTND